MSETGDAAEEDELGLSGAGLRKVKAPNKKKMEEAVEQLMTIIRRKEAEIKANLADETVQLEFRSIKAEKNATIERRKKIDSQLQAVNQDIKKQMDSLTRVQSNLQYKKEEMINEAIRRLEHQLTMHNFRLSEEKKIVSEIDSLKRSKKSVGQYQALKKEIEGMREKQRRMREERDYFYKLVTTLKHREDDLRKKSALTKSQNEQLKKEIDDLYDQKRKMVADYRQQEKEFNEVRGQMQRKQREERQRRREEERQAEIEAYQQECALYKAICEPYEEQKHLCAALITYLQRYTTQDGQEQSPDSNAHSQGQGSPKELEEPGLYVLKKKEEDLFSGIVRKGGKRNSRTKRRSLLHRPFAHTPEILTQFSSLNLSAPSNMSELPAAMDSLHAKKVYYENLPPPQINIDRSSNTAPSVVESLITESIPSTPEVQQDAQPPAFPGRSPPQGGLEGPGVGGDPVRRLSHDSGACELEGANSCDDEQSGSCVATEVTAGTTHKCSNLTDVQLDCTLTKPEVTDRPCMDLEDPNSSDASSSTPESVESCIQKVTAPSDPSNSSNQDDTASALSDDQENTCNPEQTAQKM